MLRRSMHTTVSILMATAMCLAGCSSDTAMISAVEQDDVPAMRGLIASGGDVNARTGYNRIDPTWSIANDEDKEEITAMLLSGRNAGSSMTVLMLAAMKGYALATKTLIENGADVNSRDAFGNTALILAAENGHSDTVQLLLDGGADLNAQNMYGSTALMVASGNAGTGQMLLELLPNGKLSISLSLQAESNGAEAMTVLLDNGAPVNTRDKYGHTALARAAHAGHAEAVNLLLAKDADVNAAGNDGSTALLLALEQGHVEIVKLMLQANADPEAKNRDGKTALDLAESEAIRRLLRTAGAR